jgi:methanogenic corrinoid protein MtbC1
LTLLDDIANAVQVGDADMVTQLVTEAVKRGVPPATVNTDGLLAGMVVLGEKFKEGQVYIPEVLVAARALKSGLEVLRPLLVSGSMKNEGTIVLGTVKGDLHDIGKNLVAMMMESRGLGVVDLGVDVPAEAFVAAAKEAGAHVIACSALLSSTLPEMERVIRVTEEAGLRDKLSILVGGAPVTEEYCRFIGADSYAGDAASAAARALDLCRGRVAGSLPPNRESASAGDS